MGQWDFGRPGDFVLRGGGFEAGRAYYYDRLPANLDRVSARTLAGAFGEPPNSPAEADLRAWLDGILADPIPLLDWRDRFYLEQRLGAWLSAIEQELDLTGRERFYAINAEATYRLLLDLPEEIRRTGQHQLDLTRRLAPDLLRFPVNPPDIAFGRLAVALDRFRSKRRNMRRKVRRARHPSHAPTPS
jgi:hypothetical protein